MINGSQTKHKSSIQQKIFIFSYQFKFPYKHPHKHNPWSDLLQPQVLLSLLEDSLIIRQIYLNFLIIKIVMFYSTKDKDQKSTNNYCSVPSSPSVTEATTKKKMFARKPAYGVGNLVPEKKKTPLEESIDVLTLVRPAAESFRTTVKAPEPLDRKKRDNASEIGREATVKNEAPFQKYREIFYSPKSQKNLFMGSVSTLQRKPSKNQTDFKPRDSLETSFRGSYVYGREKTTVFDTSMDSQDLRKSWKFKTNSVQSFISPAKPTTESRRSSEKSLQDGSLIECAYCLNHKKKADILAQKYAKLEEQYNSKVQALRELTGKCEHLMREKSELCQKLEKAIEKLQVKDEQFFRMREELTFRVDACKKDVIRLTENIKYNQIEKSMLLRFKNDYQMLVKQCQQLKYENDQYKKQLIAQVNKEHGYSFSKRTMQGGQSPPGQFNKKSAQNSPIQNNIYYDYEDDAVSLNFSEQSYDYV